jgi:SAM-dependent methyltransferase
MTDPDEYRHESRGRWGSVAGGWRARGDWLRQNTMPLSAWMIEAVDPQPGQTILELAAGTGDTGVLAAELVQPGGELICSDWSPEMLTAAQERARDLGISNVRFRQLDAESIDVETASLDGVLCRWGYMLLADPAAALRETRRVLKPGARVALAAWTVPEDNPWMVLAGDELEARGLMEPAEPGEPGAFAWGADGVIAELLDEAGFAEHAVESLEFEMRHPSFDDYWEATGTMSGSRAEAIARLDEAQVEDLRAAVRDKARPYEREGGLVLPVRNWVAWATA